MDMAKRNVEIDDDLDEIIEGAIDEVKNELENFLEANPETLTLPDLSNDLDYGGVISEIIDGSVPVYTKELNDLWYLYSSEFEQAYENAGIGENPREKDGAVAIYCYIQEKVYDWYHDEAEDYFQELKAKRE
jgi:hypothetical protein